MCDQMSFESCTLGFGQLESSAIPEAVSQYTINTHVQVCAFKVVLNMCMQNRKMFYISLSLESTISTSESMYSL